jgi:hypothetical protein
MRATSRLHSIQSITSIRLLPLILSAELSVVSTPTDYYSNKPKDLALELNVASWCPVQLNKEGEVRESTSILFDAAISMRIILDEDRLHIRDDRF